LRPGWNLGGFVEFVRNAESIANKEPEQSAFRLFP